MFARGFAWSRALLQTCKRPPTRKRPAHGAHTTLTPRAGDNQRWQPSARCARELRPIDVTCHFLLAPFESGSSPTRPSPWLACCPCAALWSGCVGAAGRRRQGRPRRGLVCKPELLRTPQHPRHRRPPCGAGESCARLWPADAPEAAHRRAHLQAHAQRAQPSHAAGTWWGLEVAQCRVDRNTIFAARATAALPCTTTSTHAPQEAVDFSHHMHIFRVQLLKYEKLLSGAYVCTLGLQPVSFFRMHPLRKLLAVSVPHVLAARCCSVPGVHPAGCARQPTTPLGCSRRHRHV